MTRRFPLLILAILASGCSEDRTAYPSLAPRPIEKLGFGEPAARPAPVAAPDPALDTRIAELGRQLEAISTGFARDRAIAQRAAGTAKGQPVGSEAWLTAQTALAQLDDWRAQASSLVTDVEALATERAAALAAPYPALTELGTRAQTEADQEAAAIGQIQAGLPSA